MWQDQLNLGHILTTYDLPEIKNGGTFYLVLIEIDTLVRIAETKKQLGQVCHKHRAKKYEP